MLDGNASLFKIIGMSLQPIVHALYTPHVLASSSLIRCLGGRQCEPIQENRDVPPANHTGLFSLSKHISRYWPPVPNYLTRISHKIKNSAAVPFQFLRTGWHVRGQTFHSDGGHLAHTVMQKVDRWNSSVYLLTQWASNLSVAFH